MKMPQKLKSGGRRKMQRQQIKPCKVVLDPNEVQRNLCKETEQHDPVYSIWMSPEEAALVHSILTVVKQEPQDVTEHIKLEIKEEAEDVVPSLQLADMDGVVMDDTAPSTNLGDMEPPTQMEDGISSHNIKSEPMEDIPSQREMKFVEETEDGIPSHHIKLEPMEDIPSQISNTEESEYGIPSQHIKSEPMEDIQSTQVSNVEFVSVKEHRIPPQELCDTELSENGSPPQQLAETEFVDMSSVFQTEDDSVPTSSVIIPNDVQIDSIRPLHIPATPIDNDDITVGNMKKSLPIFFFESSEHLSGESKETVAKLNTVKNKDREIHIKTNCQTYKYLCLLCHQFKHENLTSDIEQHNLHLDSHIDTTFKKCLKCSTKCININEYYFHVKYCYSKNCESDINFKSFVTIQDSRYKYWWRFKCTKIGCNQRMPNFCSNVIHEMYCSSTVQNHKFFILPDMIDYKCSICNATFKDQSLFQAHCTLPILFAESLTYCQQCDISIESEQDYMMHMKSGGHTLNCQLCLQKFKAVNAFISHKSFDHNVRMIHCSGCLKTVNMVQFIVSHLRGCFVNGVRLFVCTLCGRKCESFTHLIVHLNTEIVGLKYEHQCRKCHNYFCSKFNLCCHMMNSQCGTSAELNAPSEITVSTEQT